MANHYPIRCPGIFASVLISVLTLAPATADRRPPDDLPGIDELLSVVQRDFPGRVLEVELEDEDQVWVYEVVVRTLDDRIVELEYRARTLELLEVEGD